MGCGSSKPVAPYEAKAARVSKDDVTAAEATYCWVCKPGSKEWQGEWRSGTSKDAPKEMGAESMLYSLVNIDAPAAAPASEGVDMKELVSVGAEMAGIEGAAEMLDAAQQVKGAMTKDGDKAKEEPQKVMRQTYELRGKEGMVAWSFKLVDLTGTLDVKTLKGEKAVCAALTAPGRSVYKVVKLKSGVHKLAVYKTATVEADVSASDLIFDLNSNMMEDTWSLTAAPGGELVAGFVKPSSMQEDTAPREATVGAGADLGLCLAILSAMQAWPVLDLTPVKEDQYTKIGKELLGVAIEAAME